MPYITMECGKLTTEQKENLISRLTETASEATGIVQHKTLAPHPAYADDIHIRTHKYGLYAEKEESGLA